MIRVMVDAHEAARNFVREHYPHARAAYLGGSAASGQATATSDLDIFVLLDEPDSDISYVETTTYQGWLVETFVYSPSAAADWIEKGREERRPVLDSIIARGLALTDTEDTSELAGRSRDALNAGPAPAEQAELDSRRYALSALLDDMEGSLDSAETYIIEADAFRAAAELALLVNRRWLGTSKWLVRNLRDGDDYGLVAWAAGTRDRRELMAVCRGVLEMAGGYLQEGHLRGSRAGKARS